MKAKLLFMLIYLLLSINYFWYGTLSSCKIEDLQYHWSSMHLQISLLLFQIFMDPFEEIGMAEKIAEQHRRSATEKEV